MSATPAVDALVPRRPTCGVMPFDLTAGVRSASLMGAAHNRVHPISPSDVAPICAAFSGVDRPGALA